VLNGMEISGESLVAIGNLPAARCCLPVTAAPDGAWDRRRGSTR